MSKRAALYLFCGMFLLVRDAFALGLPPVIVVPPLDQIVSKGGRAAFSVTVNSTTSPLSYQWRLNGTNIAEATGTSPASLLPIILNYSRTNIQSADAGNYSVELWNGSGATRSTASLKVINNPLRIELAELTSSGFHLKLSGITATNYVIQASSNMVTWTPISTNSGLTGLVDFVDAAATNHHTRFYRAELY